MIDLQDVSKSYAAGIPAVNNINLHIDKGEFVFIVGDSGAGKSTIIKMMLKELEPTSGKIVINGKNLARLKRRKVPMLRRTMGIVFQDFQLLTDRDVFHNLYDVLL